VRAGPVAYRAVMTASHHADFPSSVDIVVEIPRGSRNKYEFDEETGVFRLDRVLSSAVFYNFDYGFIEDTRAADGDHTDALLIIDEPTFTGCHVWGRPIGGLEMSDEHGFDFKVVGWRDRDRALEVLREDRATWGREQAR
jgi:inorganic pyrophosphatase